MPSRPLQSLQRNVDFCTAASIVPGRNISYISTWVHFALYARCCQETRMLQELAPYG